MGERKVILDQPLQRVDFAGELSVHARLLAGPTEDLNVMAARDGCRSESEVHVVPRGVWQRDVRVGEHVVLALDVPPNVPPKGLLEVAGATLAPGDAVRLQGAGRCRVTAAAAASFLFATFW